MGWTMPMRLTPTDIITLIALWRRGNSGDTIVYADDVAIEVSSTTGAVFGRVRAEGSLRRLRDQGLVRSSRWAPEEWSLASEGRKLCEAMEKMGLKPEF